MNTFSLMVNARLHRGSASLYLPRFPYRTAKLFSVAATCIINNVPFLYKFKLTYNYTQAQQMLWTTGNGESQLYNNHKSRV